MDSVHSSSPKSSHVILGVSLPLSLSLSRYYPNASGLGVAEWTQREHVSTSTHCVLCKQQSAMCSTQFDKRWQRALHNEVIGAGD